MNKIRTLLAAACGLVVVAATHAQSVALGGVMGTKALLVIDGQTQVLGVGESARGVTLKALLAGEAHVERDGKLSVLRAGGALAVGAGAAKGPAAREIVLAAGPGGHFVSQGSINGTPANFLVDTGATLVSLSQSDAQRFGIDLRNARRSLMSTANGTVPALMVTLTSVRLGEIEVFNVPAVVMPAAMPYVLLGNSFLTRFQMRRDNDVMRLEAKP